MSHWKVAGLLTVTVVAVILLIGAMQQSIPVDVVPARRGEIRSFVEERAKTRLSHTYRITMPSNGRIMPIGLVEGDRVKRGQIVAMMDQADLETAVAERAARVAKLAAQIVENDDTRLEVNALAQFDAFLESMVRTVESAEAQTQSSSARYKFADAELKRKRPLAERNAISDSELEEAELLQLESGIDYQKDVLTWRAIQAVHSGMRIGRESIEKYIEKKSLQRAVLEKEKTEAEVRLDKLRREAKRGKMISPIGGVVVRREVSNERILSAGRLLLEIGGLEDLEVEAEVLSQDVVDIQVGDSVDIHGPAIGKTPVAGTVQRIYPQGFTKVSSLGVEQQRVLVIVRFAETALSRLRKEGRVLGIDYRVRVRIYTDSRTEALKVPLAALFRSATGTRQLFVVRDGVARLVPVKSGLINDEEVEIVDGIKEGDLVVLTPESSLEDGTKVDARIRDDRR